jgi:hypothetical protein
VKMWAFKVGFGVGLSVGSFVGKVMAARWAFGVGRSVGSFVGDGVGFLVGDGVGRTVGFESGTVELDPLLVKVRASKWASEWDSVGSLVGMA